MFSGWNPMHALFSAIIPWNTLDGIPGILGSPLLDPMHGIDDLLLAFRSSFAQPQHHPQLLALF